MSSSAWKSSVINVMAIGVVLMIVALLGKQLPLVDAGECSSPCVPGDEEIMSQKEHGTSHNPVMEDLRFGVDYDLTDRICNFNRRYAEHFGYYKETEFLNQVSELGDDDVMNFYDPNTGKLLFTAPVGRSWNDFLAESSHHGWPSFRDEEVNWETVRVLHDGETVSVDGTHLGHNLPDSRNRYCINLVSVAGSPASVTEEECAEGDEACDDEEDSQ